MKQAIYQIYSLKNGSKHAQVTYWEVQQHEKRCRNRKNSHKWRIQYLE